MRARPCSYATGSAPAPAPRAPRLRAGTSSASPLAPRRHQAARVPRQAVVGGRRHDLYLALPDSEWAYPTFNSLKYDDLRSAVLDSPAETKVIILDCCFSGRAVTETQAGPSEVLGQIEVAGSYVLTAAHRDQVALIVPGEEHTAFTGRLLSLLREGVPDGPEFLTIDDLYRELRIRMKAEGLSVPQKQGPTWPACWRWPATARSPRPRCPYSASAPARQWLPGKAASGRKRCVGTRHG